LVKQPKVPADFRLKMYLHWLLSGCSTQIDKSSSKLMLDFTRNIACFKILNKVDSNLKVTGFFVPELVYITLAIDKIKDRLGAVNGRCILAQHYELEKMLDALVQYASDFQPGIIPTGQYAAENFTQSLYAKLSQAGVPLPTPVPVRELKFWQQVGLTTKQHEFQVHCQDATVSMLERLFSYLGILMTGMLILGITAGSANAILSWGWPGMMLFFCITSKFAANYVDIKGGPERRMTHVANWIYGFCSGLYYGCSRFSWAKMGLNFMVSSVMAASAYVSWSFAWNSLRALPWMASLTPGMMWYSTAFFACSMCLSSFGRLYSPLYNTLWQYIDRWLNFSDVNPAYLLLPTVVSKLKTVRAAEKIEKAELKLAEFKRLTEEAEARAALEEANSGLVEQMMLKITPLRDLGDEQAAVVKAQISQLILSTAPQHPPHRLGGSRD
jgi:hypothetical protein